MKKYRFRKMYFICQNMKVIAPNVQATNAYQKKELADKILQQSLAREPEDAYWNKGKPTPKKTVEGFYLVHESYFDEILKLWVKDESSTNGDKL